MHLKFIFPLIAVCLLGCTPSQPSGQSNSPVAKSTQEQVTASSLPDAVNQLKAHVETISKAFTSKTPDDAHHSLHDVRYLLKSIPVLAKDLSSEKKSSIQKSVDEMSECFDALDETMHGGIETPYSKVGERIATAMSGLKGAIE